MRIRHGIPRIGAEEADGLNRVLASGHLGRGVESEGLEAELALRLGGGHVRLTSNGTTALHLALLAAGVEAGDEVIFPSYSGAGVLQAIRHCGGMPVPVDISPETMGISVEATRGAWCRRTRAIVVVHPFGRVLDLAQFREFEVPLIEDCSMALGGKIGEKVAGSQGLLSIASFRPGMMITAGMGGCVAARADAVYRKLTDLLEYQRGDEDRARFNYGLSDLNAVVGRAQLAKLDSFLADRRAIARIYAEQLSEAGVQAPAVPEDGSHVFHRYVVQVMHGRDGVMVKLAEQGIEVVKPLATPSHRFLGLEDRLFAVSAEVDEEGLALPVQPGITPEQALEVATALKAALSASGGA